MTAAILLALTLSPADESKKTLAEEARPVIAAVVKAAEENAAKRNDRLDGDALTDFYVRRAAVAGATPRAFLFGLAVALDTSELLRKNVLLRGALGEAESDQERERRLKSIGKPTLRGRHDWLLHFAVSAGLTAQFSPELAESVGLSKELLDAKSGSGFSFADLAADYAGVAFANRLLAKDADTPKLITVLAESFKGDDFFPTVIDLEEGLTSERLQEKYGNIDDKRFRDSCEMIRRRISQTAGLRPSK